VSFTTILPMAFVMIAGPQIISSVFLATSEGWARNSLAYVGGAAISVTGFVTAAYLIVKGVKSSASSSSQGSTNDVIDAVVLALLLGLVGVVFRGRKKSEPPKWMGKLETATPRFAFTLGLLLLGVFPTDIITSVSCGSWVARQGDDWWQVLPFVGLTLTFLATPALLVVLLGERAKVLLPKARDWMNTNSWIVNEIVIGIFIGIAISDLAGG
jgi:hypothetical protein